MQLSQREKLEGGIRQLDLDLGKEVLDKLLAYLQLLQKWNKVYNLTAIRRPDQMLTYHLMDSLAVLPHLWAGRWLDVGSGAGLPGVVLAIARPEWQFVLLDSNSKKTSFMKQAVIDLKLQNVTVRCERVENWKSGDEFDGIISRAFADVTEFISVTRHLLAKNGRWVAMKGDPATELKKLPEDIKVESLIPLAVPGLDAARCLVVLKAG